MKKLFIYIILFVMLFGGKLICQNSFASENVKPLKIEQSQNTQYSDFERKHNTLSETADDSFADRLTGTKHKEPTILDIFSSLIFVIILILLTGWVYMKIKKINPEQLLSGKFNKLNENNFKIISSLQLGGGKAIYLIEINNKQLIVGTTSTNVNLLAQIDKDEEKKDIPQEYINKVFNNTDKE